MPVAVTEAASQPAPLFPPRKRWTREECAAIEPLGILDRDKLELIEGELITKMPKNRPHANSLTLVHMWLVRIFGGHFAQSETSIDVAPQDNPTSEPEPDLIVLAKPLWEYSAGNPPAADIRLLIEISHTTLTFDRTTKAALYARAGIPDYWVLDVVSRQLYVHRLPQAGRYAQVEVYNESESVTSLAAPESPFPVAEAFRTSAQ